MSLTITNICFEVTLLYEDGSTWFVGGFSSEEAANEWCNLEKNRSYWNHNTQIQIVDKSTTVTI
jgi:hypothetical protein